MTSQADAAKTVDVRFEVSANSKVIDAKDFGGRSTCLIRVQKFAEKYEITGTLLPAALVAVIGTIYAFAMSSYNDSAIFAVNFFCLCFAVLRARNWKTQGEMNAFQLSEASKVVAANKEKNSAIVARQSAETSLKQEQDTNAQLKAQIANLAKRITELETPQKIESKDGQGTVKKRSPSDEEEIRKLKAQLQDIQGQLGLRHELLDGAEEGVKALGVVLTQPAQSKSGFNDDSPSSGKGSDDD